MSQRYFDMFTTNIAEVNLDVYSYPLHSYTNFSPCTLEVKTKKDVGCCFSGGGGGGGSEHSRTSFIKKMPLIVMPSMF